MSKPKHVRTKMLIYALLALIVLSLTLLTAQSAFANLRTENDGQVPFYARLERGEVFHDGEFVVIVFYRPPDCIPDDFNLLNFFDVPTVFGCQPATTDGFEIWKNGPPPIDAAPIKTELHGRGAVPVWFIRWSEFQGALGDDKVTITELGKMTSLMTGFATNFHETLHPSEAAKIPKINYVASGLLDNGRTFWVHASANSAPGRFKVQIKLGD